MTELRPFYIHVTVWGRKFCHYLIDYCIPSLLAPNNIPSLQNRKKNRFLFCTTAEDWKFISTHPIFTTLCEWISPELIEIPPPPPHVTGCQHMGVGHKLATQLCFDDGVYGISITPDLILSNGALHYVEQHALQGSRVVFFPALRFTEEALFSELDQHGAGYQRPVNLPITLSGPEMVKIALKAFHSQTLSYEYTAPHYIVNAPLTWQRVGNQTLLIHSMSWCPLLLDYGGLSHHNTNALEHWTMDGDYVYSNFSDTGNIQICVDSDDAMLMSWAPAADNATKLSSSWIRRWSKTYCRWFNAMAMRYTLTNPIYDPMKINLFRMPVLWHVGQRDPQWQVVDDQFQEALHRPYNGIDTLFKYYSRLLALFRCLRRYSSVLFGAMVGVDDSRQRIKQKINKWFSRDAGFPLSR